MTRYKQHKLETLANASRYRELMEAAAAYVVEEKPKMNAPEDVAALVRPQAQGRAVEVFWLLSLSTRNRVLALHELTVGLVNKSQIHAREVFRQAILDNAQKVVLAHNHPSGDPAPSSEDVEATRGIVSAGKIIGIEVLDHVIIGSSTNSQPKDFVSLRELQLM